MVKRRSLRRDAGVFPDAPGVGRIAVPRVDQPHDSREEKQEIERQIERRLAARLHIYVDEVGAHVRGQSERVGAAHHEERAVEHVVEVEDPGRRRVQDVALEDLDTDDEGQGHDQPGEGFARPVADLVDRMEHTPGVHWFDKLTTSRRTKAASHTVDTGWLAVWLGEVTGS